MSHEQPLSRIEQIDNQLKAIARSVTPENTQDQSKEVFRLSMERVALMRPKALRERARQRSLQRSNRFA